MFERDKFSFLLQTCQHRHKVKTSAIRDHPNCHFICHRHDTTIRLNKINMPISKSRNISHLQNNKWKFFQNNYLLSWSFLGGAQCIVLFSCFEVGMSSKFGFLVLGFVPCALLGKWKLASSKDSTSTCVSLVLVKTRHKFGTWSFPFTKFWASPNTHWSLSSWQNHIGL
jgi:hypothetical protein